MVRLLTNYSYFTIVIVYNLLAVSENITSLLGHLPVYNLIIIFVSVC